jgi:hypothetical protein
MSAPPIYIFSVHGSENNNSFHIDAIITTPEKNEPIKTWPLVDSGAGGTFMDHNYTQKQGFNLTKLEYPIMAWNVDGTENKQGTIRYCIDLDLHINGKKHMERFLITGLGNQKVILGLPWLRKHNLEINWKEGTLHWRTTTIEEVLDEEEPLNRPINASNKVLLEYLGMENEVWINSKDNLATRLAAEVKQKKPDLTPEQLVPPEYHEYLDIFSEDKANRFLTRDLGITRLKWNLDSNQSHSKRTTWHRRNKSNWTNSWRKTWTKDISNRHNHLWHHPFFLSRRRTNNFDSAKIINI